jgi:hypothetical protein
MIRALILAAIFFISNLASAQQSMNAGDPQQQKACGPDVHRLCRSLTKDSSVFDVLACFQQNRARLSKPCDTVLKSYGL